jgi:Ca2+-binding EF-hand superfamily protein
LRLNWNNWSLNMKISLRASVLAIGLAFSIGGSTAALANLNPDDINRFVKMYDTNKDGMVSKSELMERMKKMLASMPSDKDGMVNQARTMALLLELQKSDGGVSGAMISKENLMKRIESAFDRMDADKKGMLDAKRTKALLEELMKGSI